MSRKKIKTGVKGSPPWMTTYGDMITQVLVFFILLFTLSDINVVKFSSYFENMKKPPVILDEEQLRRVMLELADLSEKEGLGDLIGMEIDEKGLKISLTESLMFRSGEARILPAALPLLDRIADMLNKLPNEMMIEGHTDNIPIHTKQFPSNWELSMFRAVNMLKYLVEVQGIAPSRVSAAGYGEHRPVASNDTPEGRAQNRRVVLVVMRQKIELKPDKEENGENKAQAETGADQDSAAVVREAEEEESSPEAEENSLKKAEEEIIPQGEKVTDPQDQIQEVGNE